MDARRRLWQRPATPVPVINTSCNDQAPSRWIVPLVRGYVVGRGSIPEQEIEAWAAEFDDLERRGPAGLGPCR